MHSDWIGAHRWPFIHIHRRHPDRLQARNGNTGAILLEQTDTTRTTPPLPSLRPTPFAPPRLFPRPRPIVSTVPLLLARETLTPPCVTFSDLHLPLFPLRVPLFGGEISRRGWTKNTPSRYAP